MSVETLQRQNEDPGFAIALTDYSFDETVERGVKRIIPSLFALHALMEMAEIRHPEMPYLIMVRAATLKDRNKKPRLITDVQNTPYDLQHVSKNGLPLLDARPTFDVTISEWEDPKKILGAFASVFLLDPKISSRAKERYRQQRSTAFKALGETAVGSPLGLIRWISGAGKMAKGGLSNKEEMAKIANSNTALPLLPEFEQFNYHTMHPIPPIPALTR